MSASRTCPTAWAPDAAVLAAAVDEANAMGSHRHEVRIAFDTGHANLYLTREQPGKTVLDWLRTAGARIGQLHIHGNRGWNGRINDDHLMPGYAGRLGYADAIGRAGLWGEFYHALLAECRYRGPFTYEIASRTFGTVAGRSAATTFRPRGPLRITTTLTCIPPSGSTPTENERYEKTDLSAADALCGHGCLRVGRA